LFRRETQQGYQRTWRQGSDLASEARAKIGQLAPAFIGAQGRLVPAEIYPELLKAIKVSMHATTRSQNHVMSAIKAITKLFTHKQGDMSGLSDYLKCFKEHHDVFKTQMGEHMFDYFAEQQPDYKGLSAVDAKAYKENLLDEVMGMLFLLNSDQKKYGSITQELTGALARGCDEYPISLKGCIDMLDTHRFDAAFKDHRKKANADSKKDKHGKSKKSFAKEKGNEPIVCCCCGDPGHKSTSCEWEKKVLKPKWVNKTGKIPSIMLQKKSRSASHAQSDPMRNPTWESSLMMRVPLLAPGVPGAAITGVGDHGPDQGPMLKDGWRSW
jgi:hypothetical protein